MCSRHSGLIRYPSGGHHQVHDMGIQEYISRRVREEMSQWRAVLDFATSECDAPMAVYLETLPGALKDPIIQLLSFGWDDVARGALRPKGVYRRSHIRRRRSGRRVPGIPELGEEIGKRIPGSETLRSRRVGALERSLWLIDGAIQRALYWIMITDLVSDFAYGWTSAIRKRGYCRQSGTQRVLSSDLGWRMYADDRWIETSRPSTRWRHVWDMDYIGHDWAKWEGDVMKPQTVRIVLALSTTGGDAAIYPSYTLRGWILPYSTIPGITASPWYLSSSPGQTTQTTITMTVPQCYRVIVTAPERISPPGSVPLQTTVTIESMWIQEI